MNASLLYIWHFDFEENCVGYLQKRKEISYDLRVLIYKPICFTLFVYKLTADRSAVQKLRAHSRLCSSEKQTIIRNHFL